MTRKLKQNIRKRVHEKNRENRKNFRKKNSMGISGTVRQNKSLKLPRLAPFKKRMIHNIQNKRMTTQRRRLLEKFALKSKAQTNRCIISENPEAREAKYFADLEFNEDSKSFKLRVHSFNSLFRG